MKYIGEKIEDKEYEIRRTAYALVFNDKGELAVEYIKKYSMYNLIGGAVEGNETTQETIVRECKEEIGHTLNNIKYVCDLGCYYYFDILDKYELSIMDFYKANMGEKVCEPIEEDNELVWVNPEEIVDKMYFEYHRYIIKEYLENRI